MMIFFAYKNILFWIRRPPNKILAGKQSVCLCARKRMCCHKEQNACKKAKHAQIEKNARLLLLIFLDSFINDRIFFQKFIHFFLNLKFIFQIVCLIISSNFGSLDISNIRARNLPCEIDPFAPNESIALSENLRKNQSFESIFFCFK